MVQIPYEGPRFSGGCRDCDYHKRRADKAEQQLAEREQVAFRAYCEGYEKGHNDTVEGAYIPPIEYPEEWPETLAALLEQGNGDG